MPKRTGIPVRWSAIAVAVVLWNALLFFDSKGSFDVHQELGLGAFVAVLLGFLFACGVGVSERLQQLVLREGHSFGEIKSVLMLTQVVLGMSVVASGVHLFLQRAG